MRAAWALQGLGYIVLVGGVWFALSRLTPESDVVPTPAQAPMSDFTLRSPAFGHNQPIPAKYTCDGENLSPPLAIDGIPEGTVSLVLLVEDPDVPRAIREDGMWDHWIVFNIPATTTRIAEGEEPQGTHGRTTSNTLRYGGPCPPDGTHRYIFTVYALASILRLPEGVSKAELLSAMEGRVLATASLTGTYIRVGTHTL